MEFLKEARRNKREVPVLLIFMLQLYCCLAKPNDPRLWLRLQQLEQLQKELSFLEEDIKRVEVKQKTLRVL